MSKSLRPLCQTHSMHVQDSGGGCFWRRFESYMIPVFGHGRTGILLQVVTDLSASRGLHYGRRKMKQASGTKRKNQKSSYGNAD